MSRELGRRLITVDGALVLGVAAAELANVLLSGGTLQSYVLLLAATVVLLAHRRAPRVVLLVSSACVLAYLLWTGPDVIAVVPVLLAVFATVRSGHPFLAAAASVPFIVGALATRPLREGILPIGWFVASGVMGHLARAREAYLEQVEQRAVEAERTREEVARRRAVDERLRIARELHDSLTHSISIIKVQAGVAAHLARKRGEEVPEALAAIQEASSEAMRELRSTLEVLRSDGTSGDMGDSRAGDEAGGGVYPAVAGRRNGQGGVLDGDPATPVGGSGNGREGSLNRTNEGTANGNTGHRWRGGHATPHGRAQHAGTGPVAAKAGAGDTPEGSAEASTGGLDRLGDLVERTRSAGLPVTVTTSGTVRQLPAEVGRTAYRIVQEALTNVGRHAGPASATVLIGYRRDALLVQVDDDGRATPEAPPRHGVGLRGMHERAAALRGTVSACPRPAGGFRVRAELPLREPRRGEEE